MHLILSFIASKLIMTILLACADFGSNTVRKLDLDTLALETVASIPSPGSLAFHENGTLFIAE